MFCKSHLPQEVQKYQSMILKPYFTTKVMSALIKQLTLFSVDDQYQHETVIYFKTACIQLFKNASARKSGYPMTWSIDIHFPHFLRNVP